MPRCVPSLHYFPQNGSSSVRVLLLERDAEAGDTSTFLDVSQRALFSRMLAQTGRGRAAPPCLLLLPLAELHAEGFALGRALHARQQFPRLGEVPFGLFPVGGAVQGRAVTSAKRGCCVRFRSRLIG